METQNDIRYTKYEIPFDFAQGGEQFGPELTAEGPVEPRTTNHHSRITTHQYLRLLAMVLLLACFAAFTPKAWARYSGGTGDPNDPYRIATAADLNNIGNYEEDWDKNFVLVNDINLAQYTGTQFHIIGTWRYEPFFGVFDGNERMIINFTYTAVGKKEIGIFGYVGVLGRIKNVSMSNVSIDADQAEQVGCLVGLNEGTISHCRAAGEISTTGYHTGGLVGVNRGVVSDCSSAVFLFGDYASGGLVGTNLPPHNLISRCYATGTVSGNYLTGGLVGLNDGGAIENSYATCAVNGSATTGGLAGGNTYKVSYCYATGKVSGNTGTGGLMGDNMGIVTASFWDTQTSGQTISGGGTGKTTAEMKTMSTFTDAGWDFVEIWSIGENQTYPFLRNEPAGDLNHDKKVDLLDLAIFASHWLEGK